MKIEILEFVEGARKAQGLTVIIDVFRAFSVACYAYDAGAARVIATGEVEAALELRKQYRQAVLAGERDEKKIPGFDFGNSPTEIIRTDLEGITFIHTTTAGTTGLVNATAATELITASFVNAGSVVRYIKSMHPAEVSLVAMGYRGTVTAGEDILCAEMIADRLKGKSASYAERISGLRETSGRRFFEPSNIGFSPPTDFFLCTMTDRFDFVLRAGRRPDGNIDLMKIEI